MSVTWQPMYRKGFNPAPGPFALTPLPGFKACVLVEKLTINGNDIAVLRAYATNVPTAQSSGGVAVTYTPFNGTTYWIVDIPDVNNIDLGEIATAIANSGDIQLPPPPIVWGSPP